MMRALHETAGIASVNLGNCHDAVAQPIASIRYNSCIVALHNANNDSLPSYWQWGESLSGYGGSVDDPTFGLGQGNALSCPGFTCLSLLMIST